MIQVAIPTYRRPDILATRTLPMLAAGGVPAEAITLFIGSEEEVPEYKDRVPPELYGDLRITGQVGSMPGQRNAIQRMYPKGTELVHCDDDIRALLVRRSPSQLEPMEDVWGFFRAAFDRARAAGCWLWGVYPTANAGYMKPRARIGLAFCIGALFGNVLRYASCEIGDLKAKEDYERSLRFFVHDGKVLRFEDVALRTSYNNTRGGTEGVRTPELVAEAVVQLQRRYPGLVHVNRNRKSNLTEIVIRNGRGRR